MSTRTKIIILVASVLFVAVVSYFVFFREKPVKMGTPESDVKKPSDTPAPFINETFPINVGMRGDNVRRLQVALNAIKPEPKLVADGIFGPDTRSKLLTTVNTSLSILPMTEKNLNAIIKLGNDAALSK